MPCSLNFRDASHWAQKAIVAQDVLTADSCGSRRHEEDFKTRGLEKSGHELGSVAQDLLMIETCSL